MLLRRAGRHEEPLVTTRPLAGPPDKIFGLRSWALALAVLLDASCSRFGNIISRRRWPRWLSFAAASTLLAPSLFALGARSIVLTGIHAPPKSGRFLTSGTANSSLRMTGPQPLSQTF